MKLKDYLLMLGMLITGAINTISKKVQLQCRAPGISGWKNASFAKDHEFNKPWLQTWFMFLGEFLCLIGFMIMRWRKQKKHKKFLMSGSVPPISSLTRNSLLSWIFILPTCCDLLGTTVAGYSLLYIDASVWQMMRGSLIVFVGVLSMIFLKRRLRLFNWTGIIITVIGLALVGLSSVLKSSSASSSTDSNSGHKVLGIILILVGSFISSIQMVLEEALLKKRGFHPLQVVGSEGLIGALVTGLIVLPSLYFIKGNDHGSVENVLDGFAMIGQNPLLLVNMILYFFSIAFYNYFGLSVARNLTAVHRTLIDALRTVLVWFCNLIIYYLISHIYGEDFVLGYGLIQIDGFAFLLIGTMVYNRVINLDCISCYRIEEEPSQSNNIQDTMNSVEATMNENSGLLPRQHRQSSINNIDEEDEDEEEDPTIPLDAEPLLKSGGK